MNFGLKQSTINKMHSIFSNHTEIEEVVIYGSRAKGNYREGSDIDITLKGKAISDDLRSKIWLELDDLNMPYLIDLSVFHLLSSKSLIEHINRIGKVLYKREKVHLSVD